MWSPALNSETSIFLILAPVEGNGFAPKKTKQFIMRAARLPGQSGQPTSPA
jgi:hypothetical protein